MFAPWSNADRAPTLECGSRTVNVSYLGPRRDRRADEGMIPKAAI
jgi:hypothetical protein